VLRGDSPLILIGSIDIVDLSHCSTPSATMLTLVDFNTIKKELDLYLHCEGMNLDRVYLDKTTICKILPIASVMIEPRHSSLLSPTLACWYVSNVSIIFDATCLFTHYLLFFYTSWHFYAFSGTNLLTRCHSASSLFSAIFVFQKSYTGNILRIGWNKSRTSYFSRHKTKSEDETKGG
jgi:hypothetical protein